MKPVKIDKLLFASPGIPISTKPRDTVNGIKQVKKVGLGAMELEFVRGINISKEKAPEVKETAKKENVVLTCHGQYYVNLAPLDKAKLGPSIQRVVDAATRAHECGAWSLVFHAGFMQGRPKEQVYGIIKKNFKEAVKKIHDKGIKDLWIRPETTGKESQWGDLNEVIMLSEQVEGVLPCIDWSHLHARYNGINNTTVEFRRMLEEIEKRLGKTALNNMHCHVSGINYGPKGEKNHLILKDSDMNYKDLMKVFKEFKIKGVIVNESPSVEEDALLLQKTFRALK